MEDIHKLLDDVLKQTAVEVKDSLFKNVILPNVREWLGTNSSLKALENEISEKIENNFEAIDNIIRNNLLEFEKRIIIDLQNIDITDGQLSDPREVLKPITKSISQVIGVLGVTIFSILCGGSGVALFATGPVGIVMGVIVGTLAFFLGRAKIEEIIKSKIYDKRIPPFVKRRLKEKISKSLTQKEREIVDDIYSSLSEAARPIYASIESLPLRA